MFTKAAIISAIAGLAAAAPTPSISNPNVFTVILNHSTAPIHLASVSAKGNNFNVNNGTGTYCPSETIDCSQTGDQTVFAYNPVTQSLSMYIAVPGGQQAFVRADGSLGFTVPHSAAIPEGASIGPFQFTPQESDGTVGQLYFENQSFNACKTGETGPTGADVYQLYAAAISSEAQSEKECIDVGFSTSTFTGAVAFEYV